MKKVLLGAVSLVAVNVLGCPAAGIKGSDPWPPAVRTEVVPAPPRIVVQHVLIAFRGSGLPQPTRTKAEAETLAREIYTRAKAGEDFAALMKQSDDTGPGTYGMSLGVTPVKPGDTPRYKMVKGFGDISFSLNVGEIGVCVFDAVKSPYGWHIVKRIE